MNQVLAKKHRKLYKTVGCLKLKTAENKATVTKTILSGVVSPVSAGK